MTPCVSVGWLSVSGCWVDLIIVRLTLRSAPPPPVAHWQDVSGVIVSEGQYWDNDPDTIITILLHRASQCIFLHETVITHPVGVEGLTHPSSCCLKTSTIKYLDMSHKEHCVHSSFENTKTNEILGIPTDQRSWPEDKGSFFASHVSCAAKRGWAKINVQIVSPTFLLILKNHTRLSFNQSSPQIRNLELNCGLEFYPWKFKNNPESKSCLFITIM